MSSVRYPLLSVRHFGASAMLRPMTKMLARSKAQPRVLDGPGDSMPHEMAAGATAWVVRPLGCEVRCQGGTVWLCFDGEPADIVLEAGDSHLCKKESPLSIHALSPAVVRVG